MSDTKTSKIRDMIRGASAHSSEGGIRVTNAEATVIIRAAREDGATDGEIADAFQAENLLHMYHAAR